MRKPSSTLHQLLLSLSKEEKKRVTLHIQKLGKKATNHLKLLQLIAKQEVYEEEPLKQVFKGGALSLAKKRLYQLILEALVQLHQEANVQQQLLAGLQRFHVLYDKELYEQAHIELLQLKVLAEQHELSYYTQLINEQIIQLENKVYFFSTHTEDSYQALMDKMLLDQQQAAHLSHYILLKSQIHFLFRKKKLSKESLGQMKQLMQQPLLQSFDSNNTQTAHLHFLQIHGTYNFLQTNFSKSLHYATQALSLFEQHFKAIRKPEEYMDYLQNVFTSAQYCQDYDLVAEVLGKIEQNNLKIGLNRDRYKLRTLEMKANWLLSIQDVEQGLALIQQHEAWLEQVNLDSSAVYYCFSFIALKAKRYEEALVFLEVVLDKAGKQPKLQHAALLLKLCLYWNLQELSLLESHIRSIYRKFQLEKEEHRLELLLVQHFKQLLSTTDRPSLVVVLLALEKALIHFQKQATQTELRVLQMSGMLLWIEDQTSA